MKIAKFFVTSIVATTIDFILFIFLSSFLSPVLSHFMSAGTGMVVNFTLQKRCVFDLQRKLYTAFIYSLLFSVGGIFLGAGIIYTLTTLELFSKYPILAKIIAIVVVFIYNFQTKKIAFGDKKQ